MPLHQILWASVLEGAGCHHRLPCCEHSANRKSSLNLEAGSYKSQKFLFTPETANLVSNSIQYSGLTLYGIQYLGHIKMESIHYSLVRGLRPSVVSAKILAGTS